MSTRLMPIDKLSPEMLDATEAKAWEQGFRFVRAGPDGALRGDLNDGIPIEKFFADERARRSALYPVAP